MGILIRMCETCGHYHGRLTSRCLRPKCMCPERRRSNEASGRPLGPSTHESRPADPVPSVAGDAHKGLA